MPTAKQLARNNNTTVSSWVGGMTLQKTGSQPTRLSCAMVVGLIMAFEIFDAITISVSRVLEALFDALEFRLARRAFRNAAKLKAQRLYRTTVLATEVRDEAMATRAISIEAT
jgi:hypothetical protein